MTELKFRDLSARHQGLTNAISDYYAEGACVCLDRHHVSAVDFQIEDNSVASTGTATWTEVDERVRGAWANRIDTTEAGACALALAAIENCRGLVAIRRAETGTGADYYLDEPGADPTDLETSVRLEISGVDAGGVAIMSTRLKEKIAQAQAGKSSLPAIACVVGFAARRILAADA